MLTLHKSVLYASNHGYVHPNETYSKPCLGGVFASLRFAQASMTAKGSKVTFAGKFFVKTANAAP